MEYKVPYLKKLSWEGVEKAPIDKFVWLTDYCPVAYGQLAFVENEGLYVRLTCEEKKPKALYRSFYEPVYKDSCLELFASFAGDKYINCEMNSNGASLMGIGVERHGRERIDSFIPVPPVKAEKSDSEWSVELFLSKKDIDTLFGCDIGRGSVFYGNLYKCGDETEIEHYGSWAPVKAAKPDFHRPECFGKFVIEA